MTIFFRLVKFLQQCSIPRGNRRQSYPGPKIFRLSGRISPTCLMTEDTFALQLQTRIRWGERILRRGQSRGKIHHLDSKNYCWDYETAKMVIMCFSLLQLLLSQLLWIKNPIPHLPRWNGYPFNEEPLVCDARLPEQSSKSSFDQKALRGRPMPPRASLSSAQNRKGFL